MTPGWGAAGRVRRGCVHRWVPGASWRAAARALCVFAYAGLAGLAGLAWAVTPTEGAGQQGTSRDEGAPFLMLATGAHGVGLGRAMTLAESVEAPFWNPAGVSRLSGTRLWLHRGDHITGEATTIGALHSLGEWGVLGAAYQLFDEGTLDVTDDRGNVLGSLTIRNHVGVATWGVALSDVLRLGASFKGVRFELGCRGQCPEGRVRGGSWAVDLGGQLAPIPHVPFELGWAFVNLGPDFRIEDAAEANPLPARGRLAAGWVPWTREIEGERVALRLILESEHRLRGDEDATLLFAAELSAGTADRVYLRGGTSLIGGGPLDGAGLGLGVRYDRVELDLARAIPRQGLGSQQEPVHLTFSFRLGAPAGDPDAR